MKKLSTLVLWVAVLLTTRLALAQDRPVSGKVTDVAGSPLPGVSVLLKGTTRGTVTDADGIYKLSLPGTGKLVFSYVGFTTKEVDLGASNTLDISLAEDARQLEEVVVAGLATSVKRSNLANAVTTIDARELMGTTTPVTTDGGLQGKIAGTNIVANTSMPGGGFNMQFRGVSTLGSSASQPLFIVDGVYIDNGQYGNGRSTANKAGGGAQDNNPNRLADLNPDDIATMEVLKGASAAAIYGTRANAGVVIITTKRGKGGKTKINFGQDLGFSTALAYYGGADWTEQKITDFFTPSDVALLRASRANGTYTDWERELFGGTGQIRNSRLGITGGNERTKFYINGSLADETGIVKNTGFQRYSVRANVDHTISKVFKMGVSSNYVQTNNDRGWSGNDNSNINYGYALPYTKPYINLRPDELGNYPDDPTVGENIFAVRDRAINNNKVNRFIQGFTLDANIINKASMSLTARLSAGLDYQSQFSYVFLPSDLQSQRSEPNPGFAQDTRGEVLNTNWQASLIFTKAAMQDRLSLTTSAGFVRLNNRVNLNFVRGQGLPAGVTAPGQGRVLTPGTTYQFNTDVGIFAQQEANFEDKIIASVGVRASLALNVAKFGDWGGTVVSQLKPRVAYGQTAGVPNWGVPFSQLLVVGGQGGLTPSTVLGNNNIKPERATELEYGVDFGLFGNRITGEVTIYNKKVFDLIQPFTTAPTTGVTSTTINAADMTNRGMEITLGADIFKSDKVSWFIQPIFWYNRSKITRLDIPERLAGGFGATFGQWRIKNGLSPTQIVGRPLTNAQDATSWTEYGDQQPRYEFSVNNRITFLKHFEFSALLNYRHRFTVVSLQRVLWDEGGNTYDWNETDDPGNDGSEPNGIYRQKVNGVDENGEPRPGYNPSIASFLKLREVALYYRVPSPALKRVFGNVVEGVRVGVSGNNILRWTDYTAGYDPENSNSGSSALGSGVDIGSIPAVRRMMFHLSVDF
ncbi:MAG: TonB-dependent receptor [Bernardetiaceae bacterium]|nr:TonB-dependent receptor [Bernardetiaceae bacterium]